MGSYTTLLTLTNPFVASGLVVASGPMWRAGLPRVGLRSSPKSRTAFCLKKRGDLTGAAAQPNAGQARSPQQARS
ncbi:hypothetical protein, partial [Pseudomonas sp. GW460-12]|uniref:hypothetical protein n=1 Tax=Pseudomonas sp. GW460-12 TaxID=2070621 RepID=UPI001C46A9A7